MSADRFEHDDAAYVLNLLGEDDRRHFEAHLTTCDACRARVQNLTGVATLLGELETDDVPAAVAPPEPIPETTLPALLRRVRNARRRRYGLAAAAAAAVVAALVVALWPAAAPAPSERMVAVSATPLTATATLTPAGDGTRVTLACHEAAAAGYRGGAGTYLLTVVDAAGVRHELGRWSIKPGTDISYSSSIALPRSQLRELLITTSRQRPLLSLEL